MSKKKNKQNLSNMMLEYTGMTCKVDLLGRVTVCKKTNH